uniref:Uncharacterized protein n=1 Tax=Anopheles melas TaxID=34690 RepID=A0A182U6H9_9DIPT
MGIADGTVTPSVGTVTPNVGTVTPSVGTVTPKVGTVTASDGTVTGSVTGGTVTAGIETVTGGTVIGATDTDMGPTVTDGTVTGATDTVTGPTVTGPTVTLPIASPAPLHRCPKDVSLLSVVCLWEGCWPCWRVHMPKVERKCPKPTEMFRHHTSSNARTQDIMKSPLGLLLR